MHYETQFKLRNNFNVSITEYENMLPWEGEIYIAQLTNWLREKEKNKNK